MGRPGSPRSAHLHVEHGGALGGDAVTLFARACLGLYAFTLAGAGIVSCIHDDAPPKPRTESEIAREPAPVRQARVRAKLYPVFVNDEYERLVELCRSHGGREDADEEHVRCYRRDASFGWQGERLWVVSATDYPRGEWHEPLPSWVNQENYRVVKVR